MVYSLLTHCSLHRYGDIYPTSSGGRALACAYAYAGNTHTLSHLITPLYTLSHLYTRSCTPLTSTDSHLLTCSHPPCLTLSHAFSLSFHAFYHTPTPLHLGILIWTFPNAIVGKNFVEEYKIMLFVEKEVAEMAKLSLAVEASGYNSGGDKGLVKAAEILDHACRVIKLASEDAKELCKLTDKLAKGLSCSCRFTLTLPSQHTFRHFFPLTF